MPEFCDVALPVPLDIVFTYRIPEGMQPVVGGRVLVPFRQQRMSGVVTDCMTASRRSRPRISSACSILRRCSMSSYCVWASGSPTIISRPSAKFPHHAAAGRRIQAGHRLPHHRGGTTGVAPRGHVGIVRAFPENSGRSVGRISRTRLPGRTGDTSEKKACAPPPARRRRCSAAWCARSGSSARICRKRATRPAR